jgi:hypothetical protein
MKNNSFLTSLSKDLVCDVRDLMSGNSSVEAPLEELGEAAKTLTAKQKKHIDKNKNGKIDAEDFHRLRNEGIDRVVIHSPYTPDIHGGLAEVTHRDLRTGVVTVMFENMYYKLKKGQFKELPEEFEQLDELSKATLGSYIKKAAGSAAYNAMQHGKKKAEQDEVDRITNRHMSFGDKDKVHAALKTTHRDVEEPREKAGKRIAGINMAVKKIVGSPTVGSPTLQTMKIKNPNGKPTPFKEEVEELDELSKATLGSYINKAQGKQVDAGYKFAKSYGKDDKKENDAIRSVGNKSVGISRAVKKLTKEETEELDELSSATLSSYADKARPQSYTSSGNTIKKRFNRIDGGVLAHAKMKNDNVRVPTKEEVELSQDEIDMIEASLADLDEGRGRPPKEGSEAWKRRQTQAAEDVPALGIQLRKAASINKPVTFANGESKEIHPTHINRFNDHMDARKTSQEKADFQKTANKSHADFVKAVTADIPHRAKDTGEIVKYGK